MFNDYKSFSRYFTSRKYAKNYSTHVDFLCRLDRDVWLSDLADKLEKDIETGFSDAKGLHQGVKSVLDCSRNKSKVIKNHRVIGSDNVCSQSYHEEGSTFMKYFSDLQCGTLMPFSKLVDIERESYINSTPSWCSIDEAVNHIDCPVQIMYQHRKAPKGKASGENNISGDYEVTFASLAAQLEFSFRLKMVTRLRVPLQFKGGMLFALCSL